MTRPCGAPVAAGITPVVRKAKCGCIVGPRPREGGWTVTAMAFLCPVGHAQGEFVAASFEPEVCDDGLLDDA